MKAGEFFCAVSYNVSGFGHSEIFVSGTRLKEVVSMSKNSASYSNSNIENGSQPYKDLYNVVPDMLKHDMKDEDIYNKETGYFKNPSAFVLQDVVRSGTLFKNNNGKAVYKLIYVVDEYNNIIVGERLNPNNPDKRSPHPALIGGKNPVVKCAGILEFRDNKIYSVSNQSGHYRPDIKSLKLVEKILQELCNENPLSFHEESKWRQNHDIA